MITRFALKTFSVNQAISDLCLVLTIIHGIVWREEEKYLSSIDKTMQVLKWFLQANILLRALQKPLGKYYVKKKDLKSQWIAENQFERVNYSPPNHVLRKIAPRNDNTSIRIFVTDENSNIIRFNGMPMKFELEII